MAAGGEVNVNVKLGRAFNINAWSFVFRAKHKAEIGTHVHAQLLKHSHLTDLCILCRRVAYRLF